MSDISFSAANNTYTTEPGTNKYDSAQDIAPDEIISDSYANPQKLLNDLSALQATAGLLTQDLDAVLSQYALLITDDPSDVKLIAAHRAEWPVTLGEPNNYVTYGYYKALAGKTSAAAIYIRQRYEHAARDVYGTNAIDLVPLSAIITNEASLIEEFVSRNVGILGDSSEFRAVEHLQDWVASAIAHASTLDTLLQTQPAGFVAEDFSNLDSTGASSAQALFKVNVNTLNDHLTQQLGLLQKNFAQYAGTFYNNYLTPAINFRQNVTSQLTPIYSGVLGDEMRSAHNAIDGHLATLLADQTRRNTIFDTAMRAIEQIINTRDTYRIYIRQLAQIGTTVPVGGPGSLIAATDTAKQSSTFGDLAAQAGTVAVASYDASHSVLSGLNDPAAHPQYLIRTGDTIFGDLWLEPGVRIDGLVPSTHTHTGLDGSAPITITTNTINTTQTPQVPKNVQLAGTTIQIMPPGVPVVTAVLSWDAPGNLTFEVQYAPV